MALTISSIPLDSLMLQKQNLLCSYSHTFIWDSRYTLFQDGNRISIFDDKSKYPYITFGIKHGLTSKGLTVSHFTNDTTKSVRKILYEP